MKINMCCTMREGYVNPSQLIPEYFDGEVKWLRAVDLNNANVYDTSRKLTRKGFHSAGKSAILFKPDTISISKSGTIGRLGTLKDFMCGNRAIINIEPLPELVDTRYLFYWLLNNQAHIETLADGSVQKNLYISVLGEVDFGDISLQKQKAIASILSSLDDKIENNNRINETLEEMAQAIFKQWFVDFDFPDENGNPYRSSGGEMAESKIGLIPKGWEIKPLYDYAEYINGTAFKPEELNDKGLPIVRIAELKDGIGSTTKYYNGMMDNKVFINDHDILFSWSGNPDTSIDIFLWDGGEAVLNQHIFKVLPYPEMGNSFVFLMLKHFKSTFSEIASNKQTTGLGHVTIKDLKRLIFAFDLSIIDKFNMLADSLIDSIYFNLVSSSKIEIIRNLILPKLMNGEIEVPEGKGS